MKDAFLKELEICVQKVETAVEQYLSDLLFKVRRYTELMSNLKKYKEESFNEFSSTGKEQ